MDGNQLRRTFTQFFADRGHTAVESAGLIPHHPLAPLFSNAGMNQFLPYFLDEEAPPYTRATSVQKCVRIRGKHDDIELIGRTTRHHTFFEMLGNFSFGDYFKEEAIRFHWDLSTNTLGIDGDRIWVTVHTDDDEAADIWRDTVGIPAERIQRMGEDNFWEMGDTGPCGPSSELFYDKGAKFGEDGGPLHGGEERFMEFGNLVFTQFDRQPDGSLAPLAKKNIDTGSGFERMLSFLQNKDSVWETDVLRPLIARAESVTGHHYGDGSESDVSLRIMADHARAMTFLVSDGVFPSNEDRGYVLRRIVRRMLRHATRAGASSGVATAMVAGVSDVMGDAYPDIVKNKEFVTEVLDREERRFRQTLQTGSNILESALAESSTVSGETAFKLHDTYGFPVELTQEIAEEAGKKVDIAGFEAAMDAQRQMARERAKASSNQGVSTETYRSIIDAGGPTEFLAYSTDSTDTSVVAVLTLPDSENVEIFLASTPFYAEQGGQVGDTGHITTDTGAAVVVDTTYALPGLVRHTATVTDGRIEEGQEAHAKIDVARRTAIRRNHTGTHILHWALRHVLGEHVKQAGSLVAPDRLRFDFSHFNALTEDELAEVERVANEEILTDGTVEIVHTTKQEAMDAGAIAFFGEKYADDVRMLRAGKHSLELCGGTHVDALGKIGPIKITTEASIGSNLRRIEAVTGTAAFDHIRHTEKALRTASRALKTSPDELHDAIERTLAHQKELDGEIKALRSKMLNSRAWEIYRSQENGPAIVAHEDGRSSAELRELAMTLRHEMKKQAVVLIGSPDGSSVALVAAAQPNEGFNAGELIRDAAKAVGGGGGKGDELAMAGGRKPEGIAEALELAQAALSRQGSVSA